MCELVGDTVRLEGYRCKSCIQQATIDRDRTHDVASGCCPRVCTDDDPVFELYGHDGGLVRHTQEHIATQDVSQSVILGELDERRTPRLTSPDLRREISTVCMVLSSQLGMQGNEGV